MAATRTDITIEQGVDYSLDLDITDTSGRTYTVTTYTRHGLGTDIGLDVEVKDGDEITLSMTDTDSGDITRPANFVHAQRKGKWGTYIIEETVTATGAVSRVYEGDILLSVRGPA